MGKCPTRWVDSSWQHHITGEIMEDGRLEDACDFHDLSLHSYECRTCGEKFWYSQRGRLAEERGVSVFDISDEDAEAARQQAQSQQSNT